MRMAVRKKIVLLMSLFALVAVAGLSYLRYTQLKTLGVLYQDLEKGFDATASAGSSGVRTFVNDYSYWDDLVRFAKNGDANWARKTFAPVLGEFKTNAVWVYRANGSCAYALNNVTPNSLQELPLPSAAYRKIFAKSRFCRFFIATPQGVMEVQGATIHPTDDPGRKTEPQGYLLAGKLWDPRHVNELSAAAGGTLSLARSAARHSDKRNNTVVFSRPLNGWDGKTVIFARVGVQSALVSGVEASLNRQFYPMALAAFFFLAVLYFFLERWVSKPLNLIYGALDSEDVSMVNCLRKDNSEFGYIAGLIQKAFEQKAHLLAETLCLRETMETQKKESERLSLRVQEFTAELTALKEKFKSDQENHQRNIALFGSGDFEMMKLAYDDLDRKFQEQRTKLHVVSELLQREIIKSHEHYKAEMVAAYQREQALKELNRLTEELDQQKPDDQKPDSFDKGAVQDITAVMGVPEVAVFPGESKEGTEKRHRNRRKVLGTNMPKINYTGAQC